MKVIAIGDPHFKTDNIQEVDIFIEKMYNLAVKEEPNLIVILGDLLHTHERIHVDPLNKAYEFIDKMRKISKTIILVGNHDMCFAENTEVMMYNNQIKNIQDIQVGDKIMGDDLNERKVLNKTYGKSKMYTIEQLKNKSYVVNENHKLCLKPYKNYWRRDNLWEVAYLNSENFKIHNVLFETENECKKFLKNIGNIEISVNEYLNLSTFAKYNLYGYKYDETLNCINIIPNTSVYEYYGIEVDGNNKFILADGTVVHNCNNQQFLSSNHWMNGMKNWENVLIVDKIEHLEIDDFHFVFCPYVPPGKFIEALNTNREWENCDAIFCHQEFYGCKMGAIISVEGDKWDINFPQIISGHIHNKQKIQDNIYYSGSSMQNAFGESDENTIPIFTWKQKGKYSIEEINLGLPRKKIIYTDIETIENCKLPENSEDKVKITISGVYDDFKAFRKSKKYKDLIKSGTKVVFKSKKINKQDNIIEPNEKEDFKSTLDVLVNQEKNPFLNQIYELILNNKNISEEDIIFLR